MKFGFLLTFLLFSSLVSFSQDFVLKELTPYYGKKFYSGPKDCNAAISLTSENNEILIQFKVKDNVLVLKDKIMESDHLELWFSMDSLYNDYFVYKNEFYGGDSIVNLKKGDFIEFLKSQEDANSQAPSNIPEIPIVKELSGLVHWGIDLKNEKAILFDQEYYLKLPVSDSVKNKIAIKKEITPEGYNVTIKIHPEALIFFRDNIVKELYFMLDVFDIDNSAKDLTALSSSVSHRWGAPETFNRASLHNPIKICNDLNPFKIDFPLAFYFFKNGQWNYYYKQIYSYSWFDNYYTYSYEKLNVEVKSQKIKEDTAVAKVFTYAIKPYNNSLNILRKIVFKNKVFSYYSNSCYDGNHDDNGNYSIDKIGENNYAIFTHSCSIKNPWGMGECGSCIFNDDYYYLLIQNNLKEIINYTYSFEGQKFILGEDYKTADFISSEWIQNYKSIEIKLKEYNFDNEQSKELCKKYIIEWDKNYKIKKDIKNIQCEE